MGDVVGLIFDQHQADDIAAIGRPHGSLNQAEQSPSGIFPKFTTA
jgi:hypothetical protein